MNFAGKGNAYRRSKTLRFRVSGRSGGCHARGEDCKGIAFWRRPLSWGPKVQGESQSLRQKDRIPRFRIFARTNRVEIRGTKKGNFLFHFIEQIEVGNAFEAVSQEAAFCLFALLPRCIAGSRGTRERLHFAFSRRLYVPRAKRHVRH